MLKNSSNSADPAATSRRVYAWRSFGTVVWVVGGFLLASLLIGILAQLLTVSGVQLSTVSETMLNTIVAAVLYLVAALIIIGLPQVIGGRRYRTDRRQLGVARALQLKDIALAPVGFIVYFIATNIVISIISLAVPGFDTDQAQDIGFADLTQTYEYVLAFVTLVIMAPVAEELVFRGYLYGKLRGLLPVWVAALVTSIVFGAVHGQWNVGLDVFVLSLVLCGLREKTGSIWAGVLLHMIKNGLAFYLLFINPELLHTIGG